LEKYRSRPKQLGSVLMVRGEGISPHLWRAIQDGQFSCLHFTSPRGGREERAGGGTGSNNASSPSRPLPARSSRPSRREGDT
jgi:hypothetical protein